MSRTSMVIGVTTLFGAACTWQGSPVPVRGETASLQGEWEGTYYSPQTGRTGSILFRLKAGTDSAYGDVLMVPVRTEDIRRPGAVQVPGAPRQSPRVLRISFVRCEVGRVAGRLDVYEDPETGERLLTTFEGRLLGDQLQGTFSTITESTGRLLAGEWTVRRTRH